MSEIIWRFPGNNYTADNGLDTADMETFKKDSISSLARELCQNSVDAKRKDEKKVKLEFKSFNIEKNRIPGVNYLINQINACIETWKNNTKIKNQLEEMLKQINKKNINCLRISDFNTTGLVGVSGGDNTPWHYLVHGSGISNKSSTSGGSKGIGKFATFVNSNFNTVFYSTKTEKNEIGYEGICKLCSANQPGTTEKTQGIGYFGSNLKNEPILNSELKLDNNFIRRNEEYGSDIYILGFKSQENWKRDIVSTILESFMSAIVYETLEVEIDDVKLNLSNLKNVVFDEKLVSNKHKKSIVSQYLLLTDLDKIKKDIIEIKDYGKAFLYLIEFDKENEHFATNACTMIRYPYMKIKELQRISTLPCSAMCIIENNLLNETFRNIENPQHTDWEFKRIDDKTIQEEVRNLYRNLIDEIKKNIARHLTSSNNVETDVEGAGEYLPGIINDFGSNSKNKTVLDKAKIETNKIKSKKSNINAMIEDENGDGIELYTGKTSFDGDDAYMPNGDNFGKNGPLKPGIDKGKAIISKDSNIVVKESLLRGMSYRFFCINKEERKYGISFTSDYDEKEAFLNLYALDDSNNKYLVELQKCIVNGKEIEISKNGIMLKLVHGEKIKIEMITDQEELFSGEVKIYAYR